MSGAAKNIIAQLPKLSSLELIEIQLMIELSLRNEAMDLWEKADGKLPLQAQVELDKRIAAYERGEVQAVPYKEALASIREKLRK